CDMGASWARGILGQCDGGGVPRRIGNTRNGQQEGYGDEMQGKQMVTCGQRQNGGNGRGLKTLLVSGLIALSLTLSTGLAVVGTAAAAAGIAVGGAGVAYGACQRVETDLATDLGVSVATLRATEPAQVSAQVAARGGSLTATQAKHAADRAEAYSGCREVFGEVDFSWDGR
ncbi:MAG: hypothetical protein U0841_29735, partial [Chloroflexia bacterium]